MNYPKLSPQDRSYQEFYEDPEKRYSRIESDCRRTKFRKRKRTYNSWLENEQAAQERRMKYASEGLGHGL